MSTAVSSRPLLVELFVEELPPKALKRLGNAFAVELAKGLHARRFLAGGMTFEAFASPRRLAVRVAGVQPTSTPSEIPAENLMPASVAYDGDGRPTAALVKRLKRRYPEDVDVDAIVREKLETVDDGGKRMVRHRAEPASPTTLAAGLEAALHDAIAALPIPKVMQYQLGDAGGLVPSAARPLGEQTVGFVRPAHRLVALHGDAVVPVRALGLDAGRITEGHRFEARTREIALRDAGSYEAQLRDDGAVIAGFDARRAEIDAQLAAAAAREGLRVPDDATRR